MRYGFKKDVRTHVFIKTRSRQRTMLCATESVGVTVRFLSLAKPIGFVATFLKNSLLVNVTKVL